LHHAARIIVREHHAAQTDGCGHCADYNHSLHSIDSMNFKFQSAMGITHPLQKRRNGNRSGNGWESDYGLDVAPSQQSSPLSVGGRPMPLSDTAVRLG
jgi:hypothetical protein